MTLSKERCISFCIHHLRSSEYIHVHLGLVLWCACTSSWDIKQQTFLQWKQILLTYNKAVHNEDFTWFALNNCNWVVASMPHVQDQDGWKCSVSVQVRVLATTTTNLNELNTTERVEHNQPEWAEDNSAKKTCLQNHFWNIECSEILEELQYVFDTCMSNK